MFLRKNNDKTNTFQCGTICIGTNYDSGNLGNAFFSRSSYVICFFVFFTFIISNNLALMIFQSGRIFLTSKNLILDHKFARIFYAFEKRAILEAMVHHLRNGYTTGLT